MASIEEKMMGVFEIVFIQVQLMPSNALLQKTDYINVGRRTKKWQK